MKILAFDTSTEYLSVALAVGDVVRVVECLAVQRHSSLLLPAVGKLLAEGSLTLQQLDAIAFGAGPGSFTGLRIACSAAQGLAFGADVPVVPISTLQTLAQGSGADRVIAAIDARMGEIYHAAYEKKSGGWHEVIAPNLCKPDVAPSVNGTNWAGVGNAFAAYDILTSRYAQQLSRVDAGLFPRAQHILALAKIEFLAGCAVAAEFAVPVYIRNKVAMTHLEQQHRIKA
ncbi:MAG: tRNA (adenosine(37)-N6)-threonylcarbamoyltransferase complex dimerization subunit type 1 TsaB [Burkholderiales bacterium]